MSFITFSLAPKEFLIIINNNDLFRVTFNESVPEVPMFTTQIRATAFDYNIKDDTVYWVEAMSNIIMCGYGIEIRTVHMVNGKVYDLSIDPFSQSLFWTNSVNNTIEFFRLEDTSKDGVIFQDYGIYPRNIVVFPEKK